MLLLLALILMATALCVLVHELGHFLAARAAGLPVTLVELGVGPVLGTWKSGGAGGTLWKLRALPLCGKVDFDAAPTSLRRAAVFSAGPAANLLLAALLSLPGQPGAPASVEVSSPLMAKAERAAARLSGWYGLFNLLPHAGFDGGQILLTLVRRAKRKPNTTGHPASGESGQEETPMQSTRES